MMGDTGVRGMERKLGEGVGIERGRARDRKRKWK